MAFKRFNYLDIPEHWEQYWSKYPQGYTVMEALINWVSQVDDMVENVNEWNDYLQNFVDTFDKNLQDKVTVVLTEWKENGFLEQIINETIFGNLNRKIDDMGVNIKEYGAVGDGTTDDTEAIKSALATNSPYVFAPSSNDELYLISDEIEIPKGTTLDFKNSRVRFTASAASFEINPDSFIVNIKYVDVPPTFPLDRGVFYLDGNKKFIVGETNFGLRNVRAKRDVGLYSYQGTVIHLDATQVNPNVSCFISGMTTENVVTTRFEHTIRNTAKGMAGATNNTYITSNNFFNISSFNPMKFIYDDVIEGERASIENNSYLKVTCQPEDDQPKIYAHIRGDRNELKEVSFWDNERPSNKTDQIIIDGRFNIIEGQNLPPYNTTYISNNAPYNTINGGTYGTPSQFSSNFVAERSMSTLFNGKTGTSPFTYDSNINTVECNATTLFPEAKAYYEDTIDFSLLRQGAYKIVIKSIGTSVSPSDRLWGVMVDGGYVMGGNLTAQAGGTWQTEITLFIRKYATNVVIKGSLSVLSNLQAGPFYYGTKTINSSDSKVKIQGVFASNAVGNITKQASDVTTTVPF